MYLLLPRTWCFVSALVRALCLEHGNTNVQVSVWIWIVTYFCGTFPRGVSHLLAIWSRLDQCRGQTNKINAIHIHIIYPETNTYKEGLVRLYTSQHKKIPNESPRCNLYAICNYLYQCLIPYPPHTHTERERERERENFIVYLKWCLQ